MGVNFAEGGRSFSDSNRAFANLEPGLVASLVTASADIALLLDADGTVLDIAMRRNFCDERVWRAWIGKRFVNIVTSECRIKVKRLLSDGEADTDIRREINHPIDGSPDLPVSYSVLPLAKGVGQIALGRDLRAASELQQRLISAQLHYDHEFEQARTVGSQYRMLFETGAHPRCIVDPATRAIVQANAAARALVGEDDPVGASIETLFQTDALHSLDRAIAAAYSSGQTSRNRLALKDGREKTADVAILFFRHLDQSRLSLELVEVGASETVGTPDPAFEAFAALGFASPDGIVVLDRDMRIVAANRSYLDLVQIAEMSQVEGVDISDRIGHRGVEARVIRNAIEERGTVRNLSTRIVPAFGPPLAVEIAGSRFSVGGQDYFGLSIRRSDRGPAPSAVNGEELRPAGDMIGLVGQMPLRDIVRDTTDIIERLCIEAALELTGNNRASAAELLGLSRQALYTKLRRFGFIGGSDEPA